MVWIFSQGFNSFSVSLEVRGCVCVSACLLSACLHACKLCATKVRGRISGTRGTARPAVLTGGWRGR